MIYFQRNNNDSSSINFKLSEDSVVDDYISSMEKLLQLKTDEVRPGHYRSFDRRRLRQLVRQYIEARKAPLCPAEK